MPGGIGSGGCRGQTPLCQELGRPGTGSLDPVRLSGRRPGSGGPSAGGGAGWGPDSSRLQRRGSGTGRLCCSARLSLAQDCPARALALLEGVPDQSLLQGQALYRLGRYQEALELLRCAEVQATPEEALLSGSCWRPAAGSLAITGALMNTPPSSAHRRGPDRSRWGSMLHTHCVSSISRGLHPREIICIIKRIKKKAEALPWALSNYDCR